MKQIKFHRGFKKKYPKIKLNYKDVDTRLKECLDCFLLGKKLPRKYKDHRLKGGLKKFRELHIYLDILLIYRLEDDEIFVYAIGTHSDLFD